MSKRRLQERITDDLRQSFPNALIEVEPSGFKEFRPDLIIRLGTRTVMIEIKTGDPEMPLPSSANVQMLVLKDRVTQQFGEVVPVLVTNYRLDEADREEMSAGGIKVINIEDSTYNPQSVSKTLSEIIAAS